MKAFWYFFIYHYVKFTELVLKEHFFYNFVVTNTAGDFFISQGKAITINIIYIAHNY